MEKDKALKGENDKDIEEERGWDLVNEDGSWLLWTILEGIEWKHLPDEGGLLDQEQALMQDLSTIGRVSYIVEAMLKDDGKIGIKTESG